ncbi:MAG TPA: helix-turn-helix domain-containing protein [Candidatus Dormibacteraeota bacterium]|nr:helix-turn-helix domain-containing protein [Candidatus Dormibacteraeota bacterium]
MSVSGRALYDLPLTQRQWARRGELLEAARGVFERDGYHATTVSAIVQAAGLSQGAFYLYFADKKAVYAALQEEMATLLRRRIYWATRDEREPAQRLEAGLKAYFEFYDEYHDWNRRLSIEGLGIDESFEARQAHLYETLAAGFAPTLTELGVRNLDIAAVALIGMAAQVAYWQHYQRQQPPAMSPTTLATACASLFLDGAPSIPSPSLSEGGPHA